MTGPFETAQEAREAARTMLATYGADPAIDRAKPANRAMLLDTLTAAGVELGDYDRTIVDWLAEWEPTTCAVIASLIARAAEPR